MRIKDSDKRVLMAVVLVILFVMIIIVGLFRPDKESTKKVSLILYGNNLKRWENLIQGAELSAEESDAEINTVYMSGESDYSEQIGIIQREVSNGADALVIAACDSEEIGKYIDKSKINLPVIFVETGVDSKQDRTCICADDYEMGYELGKSIVENENPIVKVAIVSDGTERNSISKREQGVMDAISDYVNKVVIWERNPNEEDLTDRVFLQREIVSEAVDVIVTLDNTMTDSLMDALDNLRKTSKVYSISTSNQAVYCLDHKMIKILVHQNEFSIGYIGTKYAIDSKSAKKEYSDDSIFYKAVSKDDMYDYDNQKLLFPFVK